MGLPREIVDGLSRRLAERVGLELPAWVVEARAQARIHALGIPPKDYLALVSSGRGAGELGELIEAVRVGETRLFRQRAQIDALVAEVAPQLSTRRGPLKVWSAGCATGEEPYTLAVVLARLVPLRPLTIVATDVSEDALAIAREGSYPRTAIDHVPEEWRTGFFVDSGRLRVRPELARRVIFEAANLIDGSPPRGCDLVWCRNVLIYFAPDARRRAIAHLVEALEPGGFLFVGYSESLRGVAELDAIRAGEAVVYVKRGAPARRAPIARTPPVGVPIIATPTPAPAPRTRCDVHVTSDTDAVALGAELVAALTDPSLRAIDVHLDGAGFVGDDLAAILRRARAAARTAGVKIAIHASKPGPKRWLHRHGLEAGET